MTNAEIYQPFKKGHYLIDGSLLVLICVAGFSCYSEGAKSHYKVLISSSRHS